MSNSFELHAKVRAELGKGASRRFRRLEDHIPAIVYGGGQTPIPLLLDHKRILKALENKSIYSHIVTLHIDGNSPQLVIIKGLQRHPYKPKVLHVDFLRVNPNERIFLRVPLKYLNEATAPGIKTGGGTVHHHLIDIEISCLPSDLPEFIEVDVGHMQLNQTLHLSDLKLPKGVSIVGLQTVGGEHDYPVVSVTPPAVLELETAAAPAATETTPTDGAK